MIMILMMGCGLLLLDICSSITQRLVLVRFGLMVSLPSGLIAQEISANSQSATTVSLISVTVTENLMVSSV